MIKKPTLKQILNGATAILNPQIPGKVSGKLMIHETALITLIRSAVLRVEGVSRLAGSGFLNDLAELVKSKRLQDRAIAMDLSRNEVSAEISIYVYFGYKLPEVAQKIKDGIVPVIASHTGLKVRDIRVQFRGLDDNPDGGEGALFHE